MTADILNAVLEAVARGEPVVLAKLIRGREHEIGRQLLIYRDGRMLGDFDDPELVMFVQSRAASLFEQEHTEILREGEREIFLESFWPAPKLIIVGAVHVAIPLVTIAKALNYRVILIDPRQAFASEARFPHVDALIRRWPDEALLQVGLDAGTSVVILTHDPKLDDPAIMAAVQSSAAYIGVLGSRKTHEKRLKRLREAGLTEEQLSRLHAPIGLEIGSRTPAEIALSIMAEIIAVRRSGHSASAA